MSPLLDGHSKAVRDFCHAVIKKTHGPWAPLPLSRLKSDDLQLSFLWAAGCLSAVMSDLERGSGCSVYSVVERNEHPYTCSDTMSGHTKLAVITSP